MTDDQPFAPDWFSKPGDALRTLMQRRGISPYFVAECLPGGLATLRGLLDGSIPIEADHAKALAATLGGTPSFWQKRQANYERALERAVDRALASEAHEWLQLPVPGPRQKGRLTEEKLRNEIRRRLVFFNVATTKAWKARYGRLRSDTLFRTSEAFESDDGAVMMWLRSGELGADLIPTRSWNAGNLQDRLETIRSLSKIRKPEGFIPKLRNLCAEAGVALVIEKAPPGCRAFGASRMIAPDKAMLLLSFRYRSDDQLWFTVFHEIAHLVLHGAKTFVDDDKTELNESEREANEFAARCIIPAERAAEFENLRADKFAIIRYSVSVGVAPGLVVGQMQHREMIGPKEMNYLKRRWNWDQLIPIINHPL